MGFGESLSFYSESIFRVSIDYFVSLLIFVVYTRRLQNVSNLNSYLNQVVNFLWRMAVILPVAFTAGIRSWNTGADTNNIANTYLSLSGSSLGDIFERFDSGIGFYIIGYGLNMIGGSIPLFFGLIAFLTLYFIILGIERWNLRYPILGLFLFYCCLGLQLMNQARQLLALSILFYAYYDLFQNKMKRYWSAVIVAGIIHLSAILPGVVIAILVARKPLKNYRSLFWIMMAGVCVFISSIVIIVNKLAIFVDDKYTYLAEAESVSVGRGLVLAILPIFPMFFLQKYLCAKQKLGDAVYWVIPIRLGAYNSYFLYRVLYYFESCAFIAFPLILEAVDSKKRLFYMFFISGCSLLYFLTYYCWQAAAVYFPYNTYLEVPW